MELEGEVRIPSGCAISAIISKDGKLMDGTNIIKSMTVMHDRSNGLGGGFAGYGIYPEYKDFYAFHIFYRDKEIKKDCEKILKNNFEIVKSEIVPTKKIKEINDEPLIYRYFLNPKAIQLSSMQIDSDEFVVKTVMNINSSLSGAYVFSSGKNMGTFKAVGFPEDVGRYYKLDTYGAYEWTAHGRYPTNTPGWWGGAHPFSLLDYSVVHNGEISSYDANRRFIEMFGYKCTLKTDTEVITYIADYLLRKQKLSLTEMATVISAPFWNDIENMDKEKKEEITYFRNVFSSLLITGPFSIVLGFKGGLMALNDRLKLRSMVIGEKDDKTYIASEECAIRAIETNLDNIYSPKGGEPIIIKVKEGKNI